jgi:hypothetical protein
VDARYQRVDVLRRGAVHADCGERRGARDPHGVLDRRPVAQTLAVAAAERHPRLDAWELREQVHERGNLADRRDRLEREQVRPGVEQRCDPRPVDRGELLGGHVAVLAGVLAAVGEHDRIRADRCGDEPVRAHGVASRAGKLDAEPQQARRLLGADAGRREALVGRLVARRDRDVGAGLEVGAVDGGDVLRRVAQQPRRPQRVGEIVPEPLELGGEPAVEHDGATLQLLREVAGHESDASGRPRA